VAALIVIVDAEPIVRSVLCDIIQKGGFEVAETDNPRDVLEIVKVNPPALIITNVTLPGISGHEAMRIFKEHAPGIPVLMIPGLPDAEVIREWKQEHGFDIFPKPFEADALIAKVRQMIGLGRAIESET
jgi:DNA-binding NtrC family response regulator